MATTPLYYSSYPTIPVVNLTLADAADYDGSGTNVVSLVSGPATGNREVRFVRITTNADITALNVVRFYKFLSGGTKIRVGEYWLPRFKIAADEATPLMIWVPSMDLKLANGDSLKASQEKADNLMLAPECADYQ